MNVSPAWTNRSVLTPARAKVVDAYTIGKFRATQVKLSNDASGIVVQSCNECCSPTGNCAFWIFEKPRSGAPYRNLLATDMVQTLAILPGSTHGHHDLEVSAHGSASTSSHRRYVFDGRKYRVSSCADISYGDADRTYKKPRVTLTTCEVEDE